MDEIIENIPQEPSKCKKILDFVVRILWSIVWLSFVRFVSFILCTKYLDISDFWKVLVISLGVVVLFMILAHFIIKLPQTSKLKKWIKCIRKILLYIIAFVLWRFLFMMLVERIFRDTNHIYFIIFWTILYVLLFLFILLLAKWCKLKNKKIIKRIILNVIIILIVIWWWLTKAWIVPNWFGVEFLCQESFWVSVCEVEKYNNCIEKCWSYDINLSWFSIEWYNNRYNENFETTQKPRAPQYIYYGDKYYSLINKEYYQNRVEEMFHEQKNKISEIEMQIIENHSCKQSCGYDPRNMAIAAKPIIYLYPTEEIEVNVTLWTPENLSHTYPKYNSEKWRNVVAQPNWDLKDMDTWRKLYALYREWKTYAEDNFEEWFVVKWEDTISFLEEKLAILWLNEREAEEFIVYWLPQMENNEYNLIRFETKEEQDENMPLNITPIPDTVIRVMMDWKAIEEPIDIPEQELITPKRVWFTVVEWWGSHRN